MTQSNLYRQDWDNNKKWHNCSCILLVSLSICPCVCFTIKATLMVKLPTAVSVHVLKGNIQLPEVFFFFSPSISFAHLPISLCYFFIRFFLWTHSWFFFQRHCARIDHMSFFCCSEHHIHFIQAKADTSTVDICKSKQSRWGNSTADHRKTHTCDFWG